MVYVAPVRSQLVYGLEGGTRVSFQDVFAEGYERRSYADAEVSIRPPDEAALRTVPSTADVRPSEEWLERHRAGRDTLYFSIWHEDRLVGRIFLHDIQPEEGVALVGYHLFEREMRGWGIGTRALRLLQRFVIETSELKALVLITSGDNVASRRAAEKAGFVHIGPPREDPTGAALRWDTPPG
jgi:RimJ/RimL family protein N-acetyltransferase